MHLHTREVPVGRGLGGRFSVVCGKAAENFAAHALTCRYRRQREMIDAVRAARAADPDIGAKALARRLDMACRDVRDALAEISGNVTAAPGVPSAATAAAAPTVSSVEKPHAQPHPQGDSKNCWGCGAVTQQGQKFQVCERCVSEQLVPCYFCSQQCFKANWPRHKAWHKEVKVSRKLLEQGNFVRTDTPLAKQRLAELTASKKPIDELMLESERLGAAGDLRKARGVLREAIKLDPNEPGPYFKLGTVLSRSGDSKGALQAYLDCKELAQVGSRVWGMAVAISFEKLVKVRGLPKPDWWHDAALRKLSAQVVVAAPEYPLSFSMRAFVLAPPDFHTALGDGWGATTERNQLEVWYAGRYLERFAALSDNPAVIRDMLSQAKTFFEASMLDEAADRPDDYPDQEVEDAAAGCRSSAPTSAACRGPRSSSQFGANTDTAAALVTSRDGLVRVRHLVGPDGMVNPRDIPGGIGPNARNDAPLRVVMPTQAFAKKVQQHGLDALKRLGVQAFTEKYCV